MIATLGELASCDLHLGTICVKSDDNEGLKLTAMCDNSEDCLGEDSPIDQLLGYVKAQLPHAGPPPPPGEDRLWTYAGHGLSAEYRFYGSDYGFTKALTIQKAGD